MVGSYPCLTIRKRKFFHIFAYSVSLGRKVLLNEIESIPAGKKYWEEGNVSSSYMLKLWKQFWSFKCMNKVLHFRWLMIHYALLVGALLRGTIPDWSCGRCGFASETLHHVFWECVTAECFWSRILRLLGRKYRAAKFTWGTIFWGTLAQETVIYHHHNSVLTLYV